MCVLGVIVPVYNTAELLECCLMSIRNQSMDNMRIVIVDDGSTDNSGNIADEFALITPFTKVVHQENQGVLSAIKRGIKELDSEYVTIVDSDDWIAPETYNSLESFMDESFDIIDFPMVRYLSNKKCYVSANGRKKGIYDKSTIFDKLIGTMIWDIETKEHGLNPSLCNKLIKKDLFDECIEKVPMLSGNYGQDMVILYPMIKKVESFVFAETGKYIHRLRNSGIAPYITDKKFYRNLLEIYEFLCDSFDNDPVIVKQLDFHFWETSQLHLKLYGFTQDKKNELFLFPFQIIPRASKLILYGAGRVGNEYYKQIQLTGYCQVVAWVDRFKTISENGSSIQQPENLLTIDYDYIVVAVYEEKIANEIIKFLEMMGASRNKIVWSISRLK